MLGGGVFGVGILDKADRAVEKLFSERFGEGFEFSGVSGAEVLSVASGLGTRQFNRSLSKLGNNGDDGQRITPVCELFCEVIDDFFGFGDFGRAFLPVYGYSLVEVVDIDDCYAVELADALVDVPWY